MGVGWWQWGEGAKGSGCGDGWGDCPGFRISLAGNPTLATPVIHWNHTFNLPPLRHSSANLLLINKQKEYSSTQRRQKILNFLIIALILVQFHHLVGDVHSKP